MTHLTEHQLLEIRDGMPVDTDLVTHLGECTDCQSAMAEVTERESNIRVALESLDDPIDVERAKAAVRARLRTGERPKPLASPKIFQWSLGKAAAMLLVAAGAAAALPGSPLRDWFSGDAPATSVEAAPARATETTTAMVGGRLTVESGPLAIELTDVAVGTRIEVTWSDGSTVTVQAAPGSGFSYGEGQVSASIATGPVLIDLPREVTAVTLSVNGRMYLQGSDSDLGVTGPLETRDGDIMTFVVRQ